MIRKGTYSSFTNRKTQGFSLIELLIALAIFSIGLLGLIALQVISTSQGTGSRKRGTAAFLAHSILDQIQAEGSITAAERIDTGTVTSTGATSTAFTYYNTAGDDSGAPTSPTYNVVGMSLASLTTDYKAAHPEIPTDAVFSVRWRSDAAVINTEVRTAMQQFTVTISWQEANSPTPSAVTVSRYVRV